MNSGRDPRRYREEAGEFRKLAATAADIQELRDSYLALALQYERLATILEKATSGAISPHRRERRRAAMGETATYSGLFDP